ncbi:Gfo/Idh/MocA family protein [Devosia nitrariae]|uniref:Oxidoreductase n=1 Tax=Devosia nitrariae TaxID=2071872 RepID=A0ABQ5W889_9HYPH|nr:Gfo/Idh/MocA family oxidoreductase [Devosia nitrariae]GLQ56160.1 oxidoreductase [Devosia nitrariae]
MKTLRYVIVGIGAGILSQHKMALELGSFELVGGMDVTENGRLRAGELRVPFYDDLNLLISETRPDAAVILAPHPFHAKLAIQLLDAGVHVLVEKPIAVRTSEADAMIEAAKRNGRKLAVNFQHRARGEILTLSRLIKEGQLGQVQTIHMVAAWPRTTFYYKSGAWRGTWRGEGGGVLMNQAPHNLDLWCFMFGLPKRVFSWTRNLMHDIEPEDTVHAICEWESGALGSLHISTAEAGRMETLEVVGTKGSAVVSGKELIFRSLKEDFALTAKTSAEAIPIITAELGEMQLQPGDGHHLDVYRNFHDAIVNDAPLLASGEQGRQSLELANAMILSSHENRPVELPLDRKRYDELLDELIAKSND